jgi:hypothetical protein
MMELGFWIVFGRGKLQDLDLFLDFDVQSNAILAVIKDRKVVQLRLKIKILKNMN